MINRKIESNPRALKNKSKSNLAVTHTEDKQLRAVKSTLTVKENSTHSDSEVQNISNDFSKKHKCYSPTFHSLRCKKHSKKRTLIYTVPKKILSEGDLPNCIDSGTSDNESVKHFHIVPIPAPRCKKHRRKEIIYQNVAEALKNNSLLDTSNDGDLSSNKITESVATTKVEIHSSCKNNENQTKDEVDSRLSKPSESVVLSPVSAKTATTPTNSVVTSSVDTRPKLVAVSPKKLSDIHFTNSAFKRSPTVKVSPYSKPKNEIQKGALSIQIQAKIRGSSSQNPSPNPSIQSAKIDPEHSKTSLLTNAKNEPKNSPKPKTSFKSKVYSGKLPNLTKLKNSPNKVSPSPNASSQNTTASISDTEVPEMPILDTSENKWSPKINQSNRQVCVLILI